MPAPLTSEVQKQRVDACPSVELYGFPQLGRPMEEGESVSEHLKLIFDLCDKDKDGIIAAKDFRVIGIEHFGKTQVREMGNSTVAVTLGLLRSTVSVCDGWCFLQRGVCRFSGWCP